MREYPTVADLVEDVSDDPSYVEEYQNRVARRQLVKWLFALRSSKAVSQKDIAKELGCSQSRVSKIENGDDEDLRFGELKAYAKALDCAIEIRLKPRRATVVDEVKYHAICIKERLDRLAELTQGDHQMAKGVAGFLGEALFNLVRLLQDSAGKLPAHPERGPYIQIGIAEVESDGVRPGAALAADRDVGIECPQ